MPDGIQLLTSIGDERVDTLLGGTIGIFEIAFPGRIRAYYLTGSFVDGSALPASDVDLTLVFRGRFMPGEEARADALAAACSRISRIELDLAPVEEQIPWPLRAAVVKLGSLCLYGDDLRPSLSLPPLEDYRRHTVRLGARLIAELRPPLQDARAAYPLAYPDPSGEFYGYDRHSPSAPAGHPPLKDMVVAIGMMATALLALEHGIIVGHKRESVRLYTERMGGKWAGLVSSSFTLVRNGWGYHIPADPPARRQLRELCAQMLAFENHFLSTCRELGW